MAAARSPVFVSRPSVAPRKQRRIFLHPLRHAIIAPMPAPRFARAVPLIELLEADGKLGLVPPMGSANIGNIRCGARVPRGAVRRPRKVQFFCLLWKPNLPSPSPNDAMRRVPPGDHCPVTSIRLRFADLSAGRVPSVFAARRATHLRQRDGLLRRRSRHATCRHRRSLLTFRPLCRCKFPVRIRALD